MSDWQPKNARDLRLGLKAIPGLARPENDAFRVRIWRGLSWLERSEKPCDLEAKFISLWIAFNAFYGHCDPNGRDARDHGSWQSFLARIIKADSECICKALMQQHQTEVLDLVRNKFLFRPFWLRQDDADAKLSAAVGRVRRDYGRHNTLRILQELFERFYVMRAQVFHGAATSGSQLNRSYLSTCVELLGKLVPAMLEIMIADGPTVDWGDVCFPPVEE